MAEMGTDNPEAGIITFHRAVNYGAVLQTYALQTAIEKLGHGCEVIDYHSNGIDRHYVKKYPGDCRSLKDAARFFLFWRKNNAKFDEFRSFASRRLRLSPPCPGEDGLNQIAGRYRLLICGSDQVWNYTLSDFDTAYFLAFEKDEKKKNAYAASFGLSEIPAEVRSEYEALLKNFNRVSVREKLGAQMYRDLTGRSAETALDPVLLLNSGDWDKIAGDAEESGFIFIYSYGLPPAIRALAEKLSRKTGCRVIYTPASYGFGKNRGNFCLKIGGPEEFVGLFKGAGCVLTNSYHGAIFSIIYNKPFYLEKFNHNSRLSNLLALFGLEDRVIAEDTPADTGKEINYGRVNSILEGEREKSLEILKRIFSSNETPPAAGDFPRPADNAAGEGGK